MRATRDLRQVIGLDGTFELLKPHGPPFALSYGDERMLIGCVAAEQIERDQVVYRLKEIVEPSGDRHSDPKRDLGGA